MSPGGVLARRAAEAATEAVRSGLRSAWIVTRGGSSAGLLAAGDLLVVAPHPDDETFGCAVAVRRVLAAGHRVRVVILTDGAASHAPGTVDRAELVATRRREAGRATAALGLGAGDVIHLDLPDGGLADAGERLVAALTEELRRHPPATVLVTSGIDGHPDHEAANRALRPALERAGVAARAFEYPIWLWDRWPWLAGERGARDRVRGLGGAARAMGAVRPLVLRTGRDLPAKRAAIACYGSQVAPGADAGVNAGLGARFVRRFTGRFEVLVPFGAWSASAGAPAPAGPRVGPDVTTQSGNPLT
jgi:LmbE family N-acetylglucosaminyl deacetylase